MKKLFILFSFLLVFSLAEQIKVPNFTFQNLEGNKVEFYEITKGKDTVIIEFFTTWCSYCKEQAKELNELRKIVTSDKLLIIGISLDRDPKIVDKYLKNNKIAFPVFMGSREVADFFEISGIPVSVVFGKDLVFLEKVVGFRGKEFFFSKI